MDIFVNDQKLDFTLDRIMTLSEIVEHLQNWASGDQLYLIDYIVNKTDSNLVSHQMSSAEIDRIDAWIGDKNDLIQFTTNEIISYIEKLTKYFSIQENSDSLIKKNSIEIIAGLQWIAEGYESINNIFASGREINTDLFRKISSENIVSEREELHYILYQIYRQLMLFKRSNTLSGMSDTEKADLSIKFYNQIEEAQSNLEKIAYNLTIGKEKQAFFSLETVIEWLSDGMAVMEQNGKSDAVHECEALLGAIDLALNNNDLVELADIIDFDFKDFLSTLKKNEARVEVK